MTQQAPETWHDHLNDRALERTLKHPISITAVHLDVAYTTDRTMGRAKVSLEIFGRWVEIVSEQFDPSGFHVSHIVEGLGITQAISRANGEQLLPKEET